SGYRRASFSWTNSMVVDAYKIFRADQPSGPFVEIATVTNVTSYTDYGLQLGWQYIYEVGAVYGTNTVHSAPFPILSLFNRNLVANAGFEENDNSHWDKWPGGGIAMTNMTVCTNVAFCGQRSMEIVLQNNGNDASIAQFSQYGIPDSTIYVTPGAFYSYGCWFKSGGISQPSEHWLQWTSTKTGYNTKKRPPLPFPNYFTPHFVACTDPSHWRYVHR